ncbi:hypothetical protein C7T35_01265 [Variovorax sp. WS11]|uniref:hypothetical protein n=1 Tax=Variovorax sp. WS11 TaxID=1105204 RepID=UPI000D0E313D|nr:hypothetical protein [Variovorax sp. WS11]NDZ11518.1 hypothetical protein [Variovorax sp. WS11]PSL86626.1 hypothetical protein C7T35_01265 [Variovorax sp. WS11]
MLKVLLWLVALLPIAAFAQPRCYWTDMIEPQPFLGTENEVIVLADGSVWKDISYLYLYLYEYSPRVVICPDQGRMILESGGRRHVFTLIRLR